MRIEVAQLPPASSSPNARVHWSQRYSDAKAYKSAVFYECVDARNKEMIRVGQWVPFSRPRLDLTFVFPQKRVRDEDNMRTMFKPGQDALVAAGLIVDDNADRLIMGSINIKVDPDRVPLTIIELEEQDRG